MSMIVPILVTVLFLIGLGKLYVLYKVRIDFFFRGIDEGFKASEISLLWSIADECDMKEPLALYYSVPALTNCISHLKTQAEAEGGINSTRVQLMLTKLYSFRSKIEKDADKKRGLDSTRYLSAHQKLRVILPGKGVFSSEILNNGKLMTIKVPTQKGQITIDGKSWIGQAISVYLWRTGDAKYVFDTKVTGDGLFLGKPALFVEHTSNLIRTQKRNAIRAKCHILANLYIIKEKVIDYNRVETANGLKCLLEDISEKGAMIRIGGKGIPGIQIKLQFQVDNRLVIMFGVVKTVEYNAELKQSRLHFECLHIDNVMKNIILSYVYNILPEKEKEIYDALSLTDSDEKEENPSEKPEIAGESDSAESVGQKNNNGNILQNLNQSINDTDNVIENIETESEKEDEAMDQTSELPIL